MYYLSDTTPQNGCLRVVPGSHVRRHAIHDVLESAGEAHSDEVRAKADDELGPEHGDFEDAGAIDICVQAGDVVIGDNRLLHGARRNTTDERRSLITLWYHPHYEDLPERVTKDMMALSHRTYSSPIHFPTEGGWSKQQLDKVRNDTTADLRRGYQ